MAGASYLQVIEFITSRERPKSAPRSRHKSVSGGGGFEFFVSKTQNSTENMTQRFTLGENLGKIDNVIREMRTLYPNFEHVLSEFKYVLDVMRNFLFSTFHSFEKFFKKRYIRYTLYPEFVVSGLR